jgi:antitoxin HicB
MKDIKYYMELNYPITIDKFEEYDGKIKYVAEITDLPGCSAHGDTIEETLAKLDNAKIDWLEVSIERGLDIPEPITEEQFSGKFLLRIPSKLHKLLTIRANKEGQSLNQCIKSNLEKFIDQDSIVSRLEGYIDRKIDELKDSIIVNKNQSTTADINVNFSANAYAWTGNSFSADPWNKIVNTGIWDVTIAPEHENKEADTFESCYNRYTVSKRDTNNSHER